MLLNVRRLKRLLGKHQQNDVTKTCWHSWGGGNFEFWVFFNTKVWSRKSFMRLFPEITTQINHWYLLTLLGTVSKYCAYSCQTFNLGISSVILTEGRRDGVLLWTLMRSNHRSQILIWPITEGECERSNLSSCRKYERRRQVLYNIYDLPEITENPPTQ